MSRTIHKPKRAGYEYWSRRPLSNCCGAIPGKITKRLTHRLERNQNKIVIQIAMRGAADEANPQSLPAASTPAPESDGKPSNRA